MRIIQKLYGSLKKDGFFRTLKKMVRKLIERGTWFVAVKIIAPFRRKRYVAAIREIPLQNRVILWTQNFDWSVPLFQRPQHIARCLAKRDCTVFYYTSQYSDPDVTSIKKIGENLYLVDRNNTVFIDELMKHLDTLEIPKYLQVYSTNLDISLAELRKYEEKGYHILYEYIDDLAPEISGTKEVPKNIQEKFDYVTKDSRIPMAVTADLLRNEIVEMRGEENLAFATNGVDISHFTNIKSDFEYNEKFSHVLAEKKKIVGYYGAIAQWFDYDLLEYAARHLPEVDFVLIGKIYDESYATSSIQNCSNIHFIGPVPYDDLPYYANKFDICTIPFKVNSITNATSPLKLFEYMALGKPILTTAMQESAKYKSVNISNDYAEYVAKVKELLEYTPVSNPAYYETLAQDALDNTWEAKADAILEMLCHYEVGVNS